VIHEIFDLTLQFGIKIRQAELVFTQNSSNIIQRKGVRFMAYEKPAYLEEQTEIDVTVNNIVAIVVIVAEIIMNVGKGCD
jgi:hypothetical protein